MNIFMIYSLHILSQIISLYVPKKSLIKFQKKIIQTAISQQVLWVWRLYFAPFLYQTWITTGTNIGQNRSVLIFLRWKTATYVAICNMLWIYYNNNILLSLDRNSNNILLFQTGKNIFIIYYSNTLIRLYTCTGLLRKVSTPAHLIANAV